MTTTATTTESVTKKRERMTTSKWARDNGIDITKLNHLASHEEAQILPLVADIKEDKELKDKESFYEARLIEVRARRVILAPAEKLLDAIKAKLQ